MNKKRKEKMEDDSSGSFSRNNLILPENYEAALSFGQMNDHDAAWTLLHMKQQHLYSHIANDLQELIDKNNIQTCVVPPKVRASFPEEIRTANNLQELIDKNNQTFVVPPKVRTSSPKESKTANNLQESIDKNNIQTTCVVPPKVRASSFPEESRTANHLQELIGKNNNQTCVVPPKVLAPFPEESLRHLVGQYSSCLTKELTISDIKLNQMRLMFPKKFVENDINPLLKNGESPKNGIPITLHFVNPETKQDRHFSMTYKSWGEDKTYVLTSGWLTFVNECKISVGETIKLWAFRHSVIGDLRFAVTLRLPGL